MLSPSFYRCKYSHREMRWLYKTSTTNTWIWVQMVYGNVLTENLPFLVNEFPKCTHPNSCGFHWINRFGFLLFLSSYIGFPLTRKPTKALKSYFSLFPFPYRNLTPGSKYKGSPSGDFQSCFHVCCSLCWSHRLNYCWHWRMGRAWVWVVWRCSQAEATGTFPAQSRQDADMRLLAPSWKIVSQPRWLLLWGVWFYLFIYLFFSWGYFSFSGRQTPNNGWFPLP